MASEALLHKNIPVYTAEVELLGAIRRAVDVTGTSGSPGSGAGGREPPLDVERHLGPGPGFPLTSEPGFWVGQEDQALERAGLRNGHPWLEHRGATSLLECGDGCRPGLVPGGYTRAGYTRQGTRSPE